MCGIAGLINFDDSYIGSIKSSLFHRGPDAQNHFKDKNLHLIHTRLSIQDIKNGEQPFKIGKHIIVFNGEIYNHINLRKFVKKHIFRTLSDTETLLALFIELGSRALDLCDGMFAFIIYDLNQNKIILGRDRIGKKPLYIYRNKKKLFIASELNVFKNSEVDLEVDEESISSYLRIGFFHQTSTPFKNVEEVSPGNIYEIDLNSLETKKSKYFEIMDYYSLENTIDNGDTLNELDSILHQSVKDRLLSSDLDVGAFLSSGIDSSLIIAIASQYVKNIKTFTVKFDGGYDESLIASNTSKKFNTNHHELKISLDLKNDIEMILNLYGEPFMDSSAIPSYYVSKESKKYVSVILNGDGADELFAGYRRYVPFAKNWVNYSKYISILSSILPNTNNKLSLYNYFYRLMALSNKSGLNLYLSATTDIYEDIYRFGNSNLDNELESLINKVNNSHNSNLSKCLILDSKLILPNDLLKKMDIATMSNSLEARSPFLSKYMLEWAPKLPDKAKINGLQTKFILRKLANKYSLNEISKQPKRGFEVPLKNWVENDLKENIYDVLNDSGAYCNSFVSRSFISRLLNNPKSFPSEKRAKILWNLFSLEVWHNSLNRKNKQIVNVGSFKDTIKKNNILYLTTGLGLGGAERVVFDLCKNINKIKYDVTVIGISEQKNMLSAFHNNKINAYCLNYKKTIANFLTSVKEVKMHIDNHDVNIIHAHMFHTLIIACLMKIMKRKIFVIFTPHNSFYSMKFRKIILFILKPFRDADTVFSESAVKFFHKSTPALIPNGISMDDYAMIKQNNNEKKFTFIVIGRLEFMKNHEFLINLISQLSDFNFELKIVGSGMLESKLKSKVSELNLDEKIHFLGSRKDIPELLSQADCLLLPSLWEAFPIVLLEAAASYVPVITTPVGSIPSFINNDNGYLVNLPDFKEAMIEVMDNYMHAKAKSILLHKKVVKEFQIEKIVKKYENLYDRVLQ